MRGPDLFPLVSKRDGSRDSPIPVSEPTTIAPACEATAIETASPRRRSEASVGAFWSFAGYGGSQLIRLVSNLILTRLLFPEAFGLMAMVTVFMQGLQLFSDVGVGPNIVQNERGDDPRFLNTAWTMQVIRGFALWMIAWVGAAPFAEFYGEPVLATLIPISGFTAFVAGLNSTKLYSQLRKLALKRFVSVDLLSQAAGVVAMLTWAAFDRSVWALVSGGITSCIVKAVLTHTILPGPRNHLAWDTQAVAAILRFGGWIFFSTILTFLDRQADKLTFATMIPMSVMGVYSNGVMIATLPVLALGHISHNVLFPLYSRVLQRNEEVAPVFARARFSVLILAGWSLSGFIAGGQVGIDLLYEENFSGAGWIVRMLSVGAWFSIMEGTNGSAFLARGKANMLALANSGKLIGMVILIPLGYSIAEFPGAVAAYALTEVFKYSISAITIAKAGLSNWRRDLFLSVIVAAAAVIGSYAGELISHVTDNNLLAAIAVFVSVSVAWAPLALTWKKGLKRDGYSPFGD